MPAEVHQLFGDQSKLGAGKLQPQLRPDVKVPARPQYLGNAAAAEWSRITRELKKVGLVTALDRAALAVYCQACGEFEMIEARIQALMGEYGLEYGVDPVEALIDQAPSGYRQISALVQVRDRASERLLRAAREFGLTPAARLRVLAVQQLPLFPGENDDPMNAFLSAGQRVGAA